MPAGGRRRKQRQTACKLSKLRHEVTITHPFHPRHKQRFTLLSYGRPRGMVETVILLDANERTVSVPLSWTDAGEAPGYDASASARTLLRAEDLICLAALVEALKGGRKARRDA